MTPSPRTRKPVGPDTVVPGEALASGGEYPVDPRTSLDHALLVAQSLIAGVVKGDAVRLPAKEGSGRQDREYTYTSCEDMLTACRIVLHEVGLLLTRDRYVLPPAAETPLNVPWVDEKGNPQEDVVVVVESHFRLLHLETKEVREFSGLWPVIPSRGQPWDKALGGALSSHWTYFLRDLLLVPRPDGNEMDKRDAVETRKTAGRGRQASQPVADDVEAQREAERQRQAEAAILRQQEAERLAGLRARAKEILAILEEYAQGDVDLYLAKGAEMKEVEILGIREESPVVHRELVHAINARVKALRELASGGGGELPPEVRDEIADLDAGLGHRVDDQPSQNGGAAIQEDLPL